MVRDTRIVRSQQPPPTEPTHRSRAPPVTVAAAAAAASGGAHAPHVVQVWNSNNPARMRGGGGRGSSV